MQNTQDHELCDRNDSVFLNYIPEQLFDNIMSILLTYKCNETYNIP